MGPNHRRLVRIENHPDRTSKLILVLEVYLTIYQISHGLNQLTVHQSMLVLAKINELKILTKF